MKHIAVDLGETCVLSRKSHQSYADRERVPRAVEHYHAPYAIEHCLIILMAHGMETYQGARGRGRKNVGKIALDWLETCQIEYDEIYFRNPNVDVRIDRGAIRFSCRQEITDDVLVQEARAR